VTQIKRPDRFLDVVSEVKKRNLNVHFFIAGDGELLGETRERIRREVLPVTVLGWQEDIETILSSADIVVLTSDNEGTPLSLIQAGMARLPVIATNVGSVAEVVLANITGLITGLDFEEIADCLEKLAADKDLREKLGSTAREFTLANFGVKRLVRDHEELYRKLISSQAKS
jgi:glycosyltransferase involved in cell wall biosynthesis